MPRGHGLSAFEVATSRGYSRIDTLGGRALDGVWCNRFMDEEGNGLFVGFNYQTRKWVVEVETR